MKVSDYIVSFLVEKGISDVFGYPGGMVTHLMDSFDKYTNQISAHVNYNEQGAAFAACGYAQVSLKPGVAYATSGPGATNLLTGIANAYFDSIPAIFITGQVNVYEGKADLPIRQKGFQEMDVVSIVSSITKYAAYVSDEHDIRYQLEKAFWEASSGRPGPVVLDIPMNIQRMEIIPESLKPFIPPTISFDDTKSVEHVIQKALKTSKRPVILVGAGIQSSGSAKDFQELTDYLQIPVVTSMLAVDLIPDSDMNFGFIGAYGTRYSNFILAKSDLILSFGSRLDIRQTGGEVRNFAPDAKLIRIDIDADEFKRKVKEDEQDFCVDLKNLLPGLKNRIQMKDFSDWILTANKIKEKLQGIDDREPNSFVRSISQFIPSDSVVTTDVGQNQVWVAQSFQNKGQRVLFSGGHGAMGYSLPAAIGAYYASRKPVFAFVGDGGLQMNIQELQFIARERIPVKIILINNSSLGMIRHFQEMYFDSNYVQTISNGGYTAPNFEKIANSYDIPYQKISDQDEIQEFEKYFSNPGPMMIEISLSSQTYVFPKLAMGKLNQDQEPELPRDLYQMLSEL